MSRSLWKTWIAPVARASAGARSYAGETDGASRTTFVTRTPTEFSATGCALNTTCFARYGCPVELVALSAFATGASLPPPPPVMLTLTVAVFDISPPLSETR